MNKILKILSILVIGFVMFSCSTPTNDPTLYVPEPSGPETPVETPTEDPIEETPAVPTYSIIFTTEDSSSQVTKIVVGYLNTLPEFKDLEEGAEVTLYKHVYLNYNASKVTKEKDENSKFDFTIKYDNLEIDSVVIGNENIEIEVVCGDLQGI